MPDETAFPCLGSDLLWRDLRSQPQPTRRGALFVDRDGVLIEEKIYLRDPAGVNLISGAISLLRTAVALGIPVIAVTNQAGIARGKFGWPEFSQVERRLHSLLAEEGVRLDAVFACPFHEGGAGAYQVADHAWRKPNPGMLLEAARLLNLDPGMSLMVGDKSSDTAAAKAAGLPLAVQVLTGHGREHATASLALASPSFRVIVVGDPSEAVVHLREFAPPGAARL